MVRESAQEIAPTKRPRSAAEKRPGLGRRRPCQLPPSISQTRLSRLELYTPICALKLAHMLVKHFVAVTATTRLVLCPHTVSVVS